MVELYPISAGKISQYLGLEISLTKRQVHASSRSTGNNRSFDHSRTATRDSVSHGTVLDMSADNCSYMPFLLPGHRIM